MAKSLITKGADFTSSMVFMFASTNLVIELGIVMLVLLGWQFMAAEFVGGLIMITLLALIGGSVFTAGVVKVARRRAAGAADTAQDHAAHTAGHVDHYAEAVSHADHDNSADLPVSSPKTVAGWSDAASYSLADATMLRKELFIGYAVAGLLAVLVPQSWWNALFVSGHGFWSSLENVLVGPLIAIISWVCSVGNVPLAAALWSGGISFGGVIAFIFADLIAMPLLIIYRKFYGTKMMWRMLLAFYGVMALAGLITESIFTILRLIPTRTTIHPGSAQFSWDYTTYLNIVFLVVAGVIWWFARHRAELGGGFGYVIDPVCSMQVRMADAPASVATEAGTVYFCSDRCRDKFVAGANSTVPSRDSRDDSFPNAVDPICGMSVDPATSAAHRHFEGTDYWFCCSGCAERFDAKRSPRVPPE